MTGVIVEVKTVFGDAEANELLAPKSQAGVMVASEWVWLSSSPDLRSTGRAPTSIHVLGRLS